MSSRSNTPLLFPSQSRDPISEDDDNSQWTPVTHTDVSSRGNDFSEEEHLDGFPTLYEGPEAIFDHSPSDDYCQEIPFPSLRRSTEPSSPVNEARVEEEEECTQTSPRIEDESEEYLVEQSGEQDWALRRRFIESMGPDEVDSNTCPSPTSVTQEEPAQAELYAPTRAEVNPIAQAEVNPTAQTEVNPTAQTGTSRVVRDLPQQTDSPATVVYPRPVANVNLTVRFGKRSAATKTRENNSGQNNVSSSSTASVSGVYTSVGTSPQSYVFPATTVTITQKETSSFSVPDMKKKKRPNDVISSSSSGDDVLQISDDKVNNIHYITVPRGKSEIHLVDPKGVLLKKLHVSIGEGVDNASKRRKLTDKSQKRIHHRRRVCPGIEEISDIMSMEGMAYLVSNWVLPPVIIVFVLYFAQYVSEALQSYC